MNDNQRGYYFTEGVVRSLAGYFLIAWSIYVIMSTMRLALGLGMDDTDAGPWKRSGLTVHTDAKTGVQYLSDGNGGLVRRETK